MALQEALLQITQSTSTVLGPGINVHPDLPTDTNRFFLH